MKREQKVLTINENADKKKKKKLSMRIKIFHPMETEA